MFLLKPHNKHNNNSNDNNNNKLLTIHGQHHQKADADRLYVPRKQGGRGLMKLEAAHAVEITKLAECG